jgi:spore germination protein YaaH
VNPRILQLLAVSLGAILATAACGGDDRPPATPFAVVGGYVDVANPRGLPGLIDAARQGAINEVSPVMYQARADGGLTVLSSAPALVREARGRGARIIPTVRNLVGETWDGALVHSLVTVPALRTAHVKALTRAASSQGWDGIDLDYENLDPTDRSAFTRFARELGTALHRAGKILTIAVPAATADSAEHDVTVRAFDYAALGRVCDELRVMAYDAAWETSPAGPIAPLPWVRDVLAHLTSLVPGSRIVLGLAGYGYDWAAGRGAAVATRDVLQQARATSSPVQRDAASGCPWFRYRAGGLEHTVWFEDATSTRPKIELARQSHLAGVILWQLGEEDPALWSALASTAHEGPPPRTRGASAPR